MAEVKVESVTTKDKLKQDFENYAVNDGQKAIFITLWVLANIAVFAERFHHYYVQVPVVYNVLGQGLTIARASAACIKLNCALILVTMLRNFISAIRGSWLGNYVPCDKNIVFHKYIAWFIGVCTAAHIIAHFFNFHRLSMLNPNLPQDLALMTRLKYKAAPTTLALSWTTIAGPTGFATSFVMTLMYTSASMRVRGPMFEAFWYTHHLFVVFYFLLCFHGLQGLLEPPTFWQWVIGPVALYLLERTLRIMRGNQDTILEKAIQHPSRVLELRMRKSSFDYKPGQYLFLLCPYISAQEWHPFTITSCPDEDFVSVHIRIVGDWTGALSEFMNPEKKIGIIQENVMHAPDGRAILKIDGPFGAASEEAFQFKTVMLIGAGIGVTPFASILKSIKHTIRRAHGGQAPIDKVYFYWIAQDKNSFEWFSDLLRDLEIELDNENLRDLLEINTYLTGAMSADEIRNVVYGDEENGDNITGLRSRLHFGRPNWKEIFDEKARIHNNSDVGVFFCGPKGLSKALYKNSVSHTQGATRFHYKKENF